VTKKNENVSFQLKREHKKVAEAQSYENWNTSITLISARITLLPSQNAANLLLHILQIGRPLYHYKHLGSVRRYRETCQERWPQPQLSRCTAQIPKRQQTKMKPLRRTPIRLIYRAFARFLHLSLPRLLVYVAVLPWACICLAVSVSCFVCVYVSI
jgi:hypothetical protein